MLALSETERPRQAAAAGPVTLAGNLLASTQADLAMLLGEVKDTRAVQIAGVVSDGQSSIPKAIKQALDGVSHQPNRFRLA